MALLLLTAKFDSDPPATVKLEAVKAVAGVSEQVKVMVAVPALAMELEEEVIEMVGARVSMLMLGVVPAPPVFVAASV